MEKVIAVLSTTVLPLDGVYSVCTIQEGEEKPDVKGVPHFIGHPSTKALVEQLGAIQAPTRLFAGLKLGEKAVALSIKQGRSSRKDIGKTVDQVVTFDDLECRIIERLR